MQSITDKDVLERLERTVPVADTSRSPRLIPARQARRLRVGVLVSVGKLPSWMLTLLAHIKECPSLELVLIRVEGRQAQQRSSWRYLTCNLWKKFDCASFATENTALTLADLPPELNGVNTLHIASRLLSAADLEQLKAAGLDVILSLDQDDLIPQLLDAAPQGLWSLSDGHENLTVENALWNIIERRDVSPAEIVRHARTGSEVVYRSVFACDPRSLARHQNRVCLRWPTFVRQALLNGSHGTPKQTQSIPPDDPETRVQPRLPGNLQMLKFLGHQFGDGLFRKIRRSFFQEEWFMGIRDRRTGSDAFRLGAFKLISAPPGHFYADPFVFEAEGKRYLFFEDYLRRKDKGVIACVQIDDSGRIGDPKVVLDTGYHLSYPTIFQWEGQTYMLPETRDSGRISLFRAVDFPWRWEFDRALIDSVWAVDPTLFEHAGKFWMFAGGVERHGLIDGELFLFFSDSPFGPWQAHPRNPVVADVRRARPAGQVFAHEGKLIRPGQDCARRYGRAVVLNRIEVLSETEYRESPFLTLEPDWFPGNLGTHTLNQAANYQVVDGRFYSPKYSVGASCVSFLKRILSSSASSHLPRRA